MTMLVSDEWFSYSLSLLGVAPLAPQLALTSSIWIILFPLVALPVLSLLLSLGHLSGVGPLLTYKRLAPIASGIGWALTWFAGEKLFVEALRGAQTFLYIIFSMRPYLDWALECGHRYNSIYCVDFKSENVTVEDYNHFPDNFWPAQEFNRYVVRGNPVRINLSRAWEPNEWYLGRSTETFYFYFPSFGLLLAHVVIWTSIFYALSKLQQGKNGWFTQLFVQLPLALYFFLVIGMSISGFKFGNHLLTNIDNYQREKDPIDFWANVRNLFGTSLIVVDYSAAFTGLILFATSRQKVGSTPINALFLTPAMMLAPILLTILRSGCEGHVSKIQPGFRLYTSTDEMMSFDLLPVCFATSRRGSFWAIIFYTAHFLYTSLGPMIVYALFIYQTFSEEFPVIQNNCSLFFAGLVALFVAPCMFLYMPLGTKIITLLRYASQSSFVQILCYVLVFLVYGWQTIEADILTSQSTSGSILKYLTGPTSPIYTVLLFTVVPALLFSKFVAVFDLLGGSDIIQHIRTGATFIPGPNFIGIFVGYVIMFAPLILVTGFASCTLFFMVAKHKLPWLDSLRPSSDWLAHTAVNSARPRPHSLAYGLFNSLFNLTYQTALFCLFIIEAFFGFALISIFLLNVFNFFTGSTSANDFRSSILFIFVLLHLLALYEMKNTQAKWDTGDRLTVYIGVATMEMAMLNGYMWMFVSDHSGSSDWFPFIIILLNILIRGTCICVGIAIRAHLREIARPTRTRDASEIYDVDTGVEMDAEDESPVIFDLARA